MLFQVRLDIIVSHDNNDKPRRVDAPLDVMCLINGCGPENTSTHLRTMPQPLIPKDFWPQVGKSPSNDDVLFDLC